MAGKVLLYYKYVEIEYPEQVAKWQRTVCQELGLKGRIIIAHEGINGTVGGTQEATQQYKLAMESHPLFSGIDFKESPGDADSFPRLRIVVKKEVVRLDVDPQQLTAKDGGIRLSPQEAHELIAKKSENLVLLDCRNKCESDIGSFTGAIKPNTQHFREFPAYIDQHADQFKNKEVLMFCTGGIRCERGSAYVKKATQAQKVYHISGGIHRYIEQYPDGFFRGKNYVFDNRIAVKVNDDILATCTLCNTPCDDYINCANALCNNHVVCCTPCVQAYNNTCSIVCKQLLEEKKVEARPPFDAHKMR